MRLSSLRLRLALAGAAMLVAATLAVYFGLAVLFERHVQRWAVTELRSQLDQIMSDIRIGPDGAVQLLRDPVDPRFAEPYSGRYWQVARGEHRLRSASLWGKDLDISAVPLESFGEVVVETVKGPIFEPLLVAHRALALPGGGGDQQIVVSVTRERSSLVALRREFTTDLLPYVALLALGLTLAGVVQFMVGLGPLSQISARVAALNQGEAARIGADVPLEVRPLAAEIDRLLGEREAQLVKARKRAAELAHVFKTPLQALMGEAHRLRGAGNAAAADGIEEIAQTMRRHVDRELHAVRDIAAGEGSADPARIIDDLIAVLRRVPPYAALQWTVTRLSGARAAADPADLTEALGALLENAARFATGQVSVLITDDPDGRLRIIVRDDGKGMAEPPAADPAGGAAAGGGAGIGLTIAADVARAAGGYLQLSNTAPGFEAAMILTARAA